MKQLDGEMKQNVLGRCPIDKVPTTSWNKCALMYVLYGPGMVPGGGLNGPMSCFPMDWGMISYPVMCDVIWRTRHFPGGSV